MHALVPGLAIAWLASTSPSPADPIVIEAKITALRTADAVVPTDAGSFAFEIDRSHHTCGGATPSAGWQAEVSIPRAADTDVLDRYRDFVATARLAHRLGKTVTLYLDGCAGDAARVVDIEIR